MLFVCVSATSCVFGQMGDINETKKVVFGIDSKENNICDEDIFIYLNSKRINGLSKIDEPDYYIKSDRFICKIPDIGILNDINIIEAWSLTKEFTITHIEILICNKRKGWCK